MDIIYLHTLKIDTVIGVFDWEQRIRQSVILDLDMAVDTRAAAASDSLHDTLDYKAISRRIIDFVEGGRFALVETLAEHVAEIILGEFPVPWLRLRVNKRGAVRGAVDVGVIIERGRRE